MRIAFHTAMFPILRDALQGEQPLGFGYLAAFLRARFPDIGIVLARDEQALLDSGADIVGITCVTYTYGCAREIARRAKEQMGATTVLGGPHVTTLPEGMGREFDFGIVGEGEETFAELVAQIIDSPTPSAPETINGLTWWRGEERVVNPRRALIEPLDTLAFPDRDLFGGAEALGGRTVTLITSRGCPHRCFFCSTTQHWGKRLRTFSTDYVIAEIEEIVQRYKPSILHFEDDVFVSSAKRLGEMAEKMLSRGLHKRVVLHVSARADRVTDEVCGILRSINTRTVYMGLESSEDHVLEALGKRGITGETNQRALDSVSQHGMRAIASFMFGVPGETIDDAYRTYSFILRNIEKFEHVEASPLQLFPGTEFWDQAQAKGLIDENLTGIVYDEADVLDGWASTMERYPKLTDTMTRGEIAVITLVHKQLTSHIDERAANARLRDEIAGLAQKNIDALGIKATSRELLRKTARRLGGG